MSTLMENKLNKPSIEKKGRKDLFTLVSELKEELKKVSWTTKKELISATKIVVISVFVFGMGIYFTDLLIKGTLELVKRSVLFIFG